MSALISQSSITTSMANQLATAICNNASHQGLKICVRVLDRYGYPLAFQRMNGAPLHSIQIAEDKAFTAISFGLATHVWQERLKENGHLRQTLSQMPRMLMPLHVNDELVGAIGVSGASEQQDIDCARTGLTLFFAETQDA